MVSSPVRAAGNNEQRNVFFRLLAWYCSWAVPGLGMFSVAYIVFSIGEVKIFQQILAPACWVTYADCQSNMVEHLSGYIQICGIMAGMLLWGALGNITGRKWGSRCVAMIMLSGVILLTFSPYASSAYGYFVFFMIAQTWYGFGVGGEYPMASSSAAEHSQTTPELLALRGRQVVLVFSNQGMGNLVNACVITLCMAIFGQTGACPEPGVAGGCPGMSVSGSRNTLVLMYGFGAVACLVMVAYRLVYLEESEMFEHHKLFEAKHMNRAAERRIKLTRSLVQLRYYAPRLFVASCAWICNDFAFYGNKLSQHIFIDILFPTATPYKKQQWTILNNAVALMGYYCAAYLIDRPWYGRRRMQTIGFAWMFVLYLICYLIYDTVTKTVPGTNPPQSANLGGLQAFQFLYYFSSFWNQFGPNCTTFLVASEMFPTAVRTSYHGYSACMGKIGAIVSSLWFSYVSSKMIFLLSALWAIGGLLLTVFWLADTTLLDLQEYDRLNTCILNGRFAEYHGEAVNPKHLSLWEIYVGWHNNYNPELDLQEREREANVKS